jgi:predicted DNA-binding transcriptional regulator AlpA
MLHDISPAAARQRYLTYRQLAERQQKSLTTIWRQVKRGELPPPVHLSKGRVGFPVDLIEAWEAARLADAVGDGIEVGV